MAEKSNSNSFPLSDDEEVDDDDGSTFHHLHRQQPSMHLQPSGSVKNDRWGGRFGNYQRNQWDNEVKNSYQGNYGGGDSVRNAGDHNGNGRSRGSGSDENNASVKGARWGGWGDQGHGSGRDAVRNGNENGRGRGSESGENNASGYEVQAIDSQQNPIQDGTDGARLYHPFHCWEKDTEFEGIGRNVAKAIQRISWQMENKLQGKVQESEGESLKDGMKPFRNGNERAGSDRREYGGREGHSYGGHSGRNITGELSKDPETKEGIDGEKEHATSGDNSGKTERNLPLSTVCLQNTMTVEEYEKQQLEKRKALEAMKNSIERKVTIDKEFESMQQLVGKKKEDRLFIKLNSEKDKLKKKKDILDKGEKVRKLVSINEFLKPADGEMPTGRGRDERGGFGGSLPSQQEPGDAAPALGDPSQFPALGGAGKA